MRTRLTNADRTLATLKAVSVPRLRRGWHGATETRHLIERENASQALRRPFDANHRPSARRLKRLQAETGVNEQSQHLLPSVIVHDQIHLLVGDTVDYTKNHLLSTLSP